MNPWQFLITVVVCWLRDLQHKQNDYLREEIRVLREHIPRKRIPFTDDQRRRLAAKGHVLGRTVLEELGTLVTPNTILRWHRNLIARKYDGSAKRGPGRKRVSQEARELTIQFARENVSWGYDRIQGALKNLGHAVSPTSIARILKAAGIQPAPERRKHMPWKTFLAAHWEAIAATDFFTVEIVGLCPDPDGSWMKQMARNLTDSADGFLVGKQYLIHDRDPLFTQDFQMILHTVGVDALKLPPKSPNLNAYAERFVRSIKQECLDKLVPFGERHLRLAIEAFMAHYHAERNHQGLGNELICPDDHAEASGGEIACRERLGGMLKYYYRQAA